MNTPRRLLDDPDLLSSSERQALLAGEHIRPPAGQRDAIWAALSGGGSPPPPVTPSTPSDGGASSLAGSGAAAAAASKVSTLTVITSSIVFKSVVMIGSVISISVATYQLTHPATAVRSSAIATTAPSVERASNHDEARSTETPRAEATSSASVDRALPSSPRNDSALENTTRTGAMVAPTTTVTSDVSPSSNAASTASTAAIEPQPDVSTAASAAASAAPSEAPSEARQESLLVGQARDAVRRGDGATALKLLEEARSKFPRGVLGQEREALSIEALAASGQQAAATQRASAFIQAHPDSPYVARLRRFAP